MKAVARCIVLFCLTLMAGCADMGIENPFSPAPAVAPASGTENIPATPQPSEIFYDQFPDIPIPSDMKVDRERSLITSAQDGTRVGLITVEGRVDIASLNNAMIHNMARQGWALRAATSGSKNIQIYEKDTRYVAIYTYEQMFSTSMEIWVALRLGSGAYPAPAAGGGSFAIDPGPGGQSGQSGQSGPSGQFSQSGGISQRGLSN